MAKKRNMLAISAVTLLQRGLTPEEVAAKLKIRKEQIASLGAIGDRLVRAQLRTSVPVSEATTAVGPLNGDVQEV